MGVLDVDDPFSHLENGNHPLTLRSQFFKKRKAFSYEQEVRAICPLSLHGLFADGMTEEIPEPSCGIGKHLEINLHHLAHEFVVSPFAVDSFFELVSALLQRYQVEIPVRHSSLKVVLCGANRFSQTLKFVLCMCSKPIKSRRGTLRRHLERRE